MYSSLCAAHKLPPPARNTIGFIVHFHCPQHLCIPGSFWLVPPPQGSAVLSLWEDLCSTGTACSVGSSLFFLFFWKWTAWLLYQRERGGGTGGYIRGQSPDHIISVLLALGGLPQELYRMSSVNTSCAYSNTYTCWRAALGGSSGFADEVFWRVHHLPRERKRERDKSISS